MKSLLVSLLAVFALSGCLENAEDLKLMREIYCGENVSKETREKLILAIKKKIENYPIGGICGDVAKEEANGD